MGNDKISYGEFESILKEFVYYDKDYICPHLNNCTSVKKHSELVCGDKKLCPVVRLINDGIEKSVINKGQSDRSINGALLEKEALEVIQKHIGWDFKKANISILSGRGLKKNRPDVYFKINPDSTLGTDVNDSDIVFYDENKKEPVHITSVKNSFRDRYKSIGGAANFIKQRYPLCKTSIYTFDYGQITRSGERRSELGKDSKPTAQRRYFMKENIMVYSTNPKTSFGNGVRSVVDMIKDLKRELL